jgi:hypothetical protein
MNHREVGKREIEREHLSAFLDAYEAATAEFFPEMINSETPDFIGRDAQGRIVGIEVTQLRFAPDEQDMRRIFPPNPTDDQLEVLFIHGFGPPCPNSCPYNTLFTNSVKPNGLVNEGFTPLRHYAGLRAQPHV